MSECWVYHMSYIFQQIIGKYIIKIPSKYSHTCKNVLKKKHVQQTINFCNPDFCANMCFVHPLLWSGSVFGNNCRFNEAAHTRAHTLTRSCPQRNTHSLSARFTHSVELKRCWCMSNCRQIQKDAPSTQQHRAENYQWPAFQLQRHTQRTHTSSARTHLT